MKRINLLIGLVCGIVALDVLVSREPANRDDEKSGVGTNTGADVNTSAKVNAGSAFSPALTWELPRVGGDRLGSADLAGKIVVIDFWATWCAPCRAEIPSYVELQEEFRDKGVVFVGVSLDQGANADSTVREFMEDYNINYPIVMGDMNMNETFGGIMAVPTTFVIDREGRIVQRKVGYKPKSYFEDLLNKIL